MNYGNKFTFDYIGISEVFKCEDDRCLNWPGYHNLTTRTRPDRNRGAVGLFIKENLQTQKLPNCINSSCLRICLY